MPNTELTRRTFLGSLAAGVAAGAARRPNIVLILADDMGFSDIGCYGGEINTPNLDKLAQGGVRFTRFHNTARCCPTRASLLTGLYPHQAGIGAMSYRRFISYNVVGGVAWVCLFISAGHFFGGLAVVKKNFTLVIMAIIIMFFTALVFKSSPLWVYYESEGRK